MNRLLEIIAIVIAVFIIFSPDISTVSAAPILKLHSEGHDVKTLQQMLQGQNYTVKVTGIFDTATQSAVKSFQENHNLSDTGIVDHQTWWVLSGKGTAASISEDPPVVKKAPTVVTPRGTNEPALPSTIDTTKKPQSEESAVNAIRSQKVSETEPFLPGSKVSSIVSTAKRYIGTPYVYGGESPKGFDCSGYLQYVFKQNNYVIPRTADEQYKLGKKVSVNKLQAGDLVFFDTDLKEISHCGLYLGDGQFIHASSSRGVRIDRLDNSYWQKYFVSGKHIVE